MAGNVDRRIIQMEFDNKQFEKNIAKSTKSVEELKEAMDFEETSRGLEKFSNSMDALSFNKLEEGMEKLVNKFTGLGDAGEYVISRIRAGIEGLARDVEYFMKDLTTGQIPIGQNKYDQMNKAVMTIVSSEKATEEQAYNTMERIMAYTDQTSHNFNTMVGQLANLTSIGVGLNEAERLLEGIGNAATYAGQGAENAALSMSLLTKRMGPESFLGYEQFLQLANTARVVTDKWRQQALEAAEAVGTLKKKGDKYYTNVKGQKSIEVTATNLENTLRNRWLTGAALKKLYENYEFGDTMDELAHPEKALDSFGKTAYLTGQRALTLTDALNAMKESVSSGWMQSFRYIFGDVTEAAERFTNVADAVIGVLEKIKNYRNEILRNFALNGGRDSVFSLLFGSYAEDAEEGAYGLLDVLTNIGKTISDAFNDLVMLFLPENMRAIWNDVGFIESGGREAFLGVALQRFVSSIQESLQKFRDFFNEGIDIGGGKTMSRLQVIQKILDGVVAALKFGWDILTGIIYFTSLISGNLGGSFDAIITFLGKLGEEIYNTEEATGDSGTIKKFFTDMAETLKPVTDGINNVVSAMTHFLELLFGLDNDSKERGKNLEAIGSFLLVIGDVIAKIAGPVLDFLATVINLITKLFTGGVTKEKMAAFGKDFGDAFGVMMQSFADALPESFKFLKNWIYDLFGLWEDESQGDSKSFFTFLRKLFTGGFKNFGEFLSQLTQGFSLSKALETGFGFGAAFNFLNTVIGWFKGTNLYALIMAFLGVAAVGTLWRLLAHAKKAIKTITVFFDDVGGNLKQGFTGEYEWFGERILRLAKAIGILALVVVALGSMNSDNMVQGLLGLGAIMAAMFGFFWLMSKNKATMAQQAMIEVMLVSLAASIVLIAAAVSIMALALIPLSLDPKRMITAVLGLAAILTIIGGFFVIMLNTLDKLTFSIGGAQGKGVNQWTGIAKMAAMLLSLSLAVGILSVAIGALTVALTPLALTGWEGMIRAIIAFGAILTMIGVFMVAMLNQMDTLAFTMGGGKGGMSGVGKMAVMMLALSTSVAILAVGIGALVVAITPLAMMSWGGFVRAMAGLGIILLELGAMMKFLTTITTNDKAATIKIAGLAAFAASIGILVFSLIPLALMPWAAWGRAMLGLGIVLAELIGFMKLAQVAGVSGVALGGFAAFAASIGILMFSLQPIAYMQWDQWSRAMIGLGVVLLELIGFMKLAQVVKVDGVSLGGFIGFALSIAILIFALKPLAEMDPQGYQQALIGLATVMLEVVVLMAIMKELKPDLKTAGSTLLLLIGLGASMVLFGIAFNEVKDVPWQNLVAFAAGISVLLVAIAGASVLAKAGGIMGMIVLAAGLAMIVGVISLLAPVLIGSVMGALRDAAGDLAIIADLMGTVSGKMGGVDEGGFDKAMRVIDKVAAIVGKILGFVFSAGSTGVFMTCMAQLVLAADEMVDFNQRINMLSADGGTEKAMTIITSYETLFTEHLSKFSGYTAYSNGFFSTMFTLGSAFQFFDNMTKNMASASENQGLQLIKQLAGCASDLDVIYKMDLDKFKQQLGELGGAMLLYAQGAKAVDGEEITDDTDVGGAITLLGKISDSLSQSGGFTIPENMPTDKALTDFGIQLAALAGALVTFEEAGKGLGTGTEQALATLDFFAKLKEKLLGMEGFGSELNGAIDSFKGKNGEFIQKDELQTFGEDIAQLGSAMANFAASTQYTDEETKEVKAIDFTKATDALTAIASLNDKLPSLVTVDSYVTEQRETLEDLAGQIELLGNAMNDFHTKTTEVNKKGETTHKEFDFSNAVEFLEDIVSIQERLGTVKIKSFSLESLFVDHGMTLGQLGSQLEQLGPGIRDFSTAINGGENGPAFDPEAAKSAIKLLDETIVPFLSTLSNRMPEVGGLWRTIGQAFSGHDMTLKELGDQIGELGNGLGSLGAGLNKGKWNKDLNFDSVFSALDSIVSIMIQLSAVDDLYGSTAVVSFEKLTEFVNLLGNGLAAGDSTSGNAVPPIAKSLAAFMNAISTEVGKFAGTEEELSLLKSRLEVFSMFINSLGTMVSTDFTGNWTEIGTKMTTDLAGSIVTGMTGVTTAVENMMKSAYSKGQNAEGVNWFDLGKYIGLGVENGVKYASENNVTPAVKQMMVDAYDAGKQEIDAHSPSRVFAELGEFMGAGTAEGIKTSTKEVGENAGMMGEVALEKARDMIALISAVMAEDISAHPTISPILDMTNLNTGLNEFKNSLTGFNVNLDTSTSVARAGRVGTSAYEDSDGNRPRVDFSGIYDRMNQMNERIDKLGTSIKQMKLVLDTGVLAGGVTDGVDSNLARNQFYAGRNN